MESSEYKQIALLPPNPTTKRGFRVAWSSNPQETYIAYPCQNNVVIRNIANPQRSLVYTDFMNKVTCVKFSPDGNYIASGDEKGKVRICSFNEETREVVVKKEHAMLGGAVTSISWTDDGQRICAAGEGKDMFAKAVLVDSGSKVGDLFGPSKNVIAMDIRKKPYRLVMGGENLEMYVFDGVPFKHAKTLHTHQNFVNRILFRPDGKQFVSVSSDKNVVIHDSETLEPVTTIEKAHTKGVMDVAWLGDDTIMTCSTDNSLKIWSVEDGQEIRALSIEQDTTEKVENQQLGLIAESEAFWSVSLSSNINIFQGQDIFEKGIYTPSKVIQGHQNYIQSLLFIRGTLISCDQDGKVFSWDPDFQANIFKGEHHKSIVSHLSALGDYVFSASVDGIIKKSQRRGESHSFEYVGQAKIDGQPLAMVAGLDKILYVLGNNNQVSLFEVESFTLVRNQEFKDFEATSLTHAGDELWVGDKKGMIHILNSGDLSEKTTIEKKHNHPVTIMKTSRDGKLVASGDNYRYIFVFNAETKDEVGCFTYHTARIIGLDFNHDSTALLTSSLDLNVGVARLAEKSKKIIHRSNEKELTAAVFDDEGKFFTSGYDCSIRLWGL